MKLTWMSGTGIVVGVGLACLVATGAAIALGVVSAPGTLHVRGGKDPKIILVESVPVETSLGNPDTYRAAAFWQSRAAAARRELCFEEFYLSNWPGEPLEPILDEIGKAAARGVKVRILLDQGMHRTYPQPADSLGKIPNIEVRTIDFGSIGGGVQHSKYFTVDGEAVFLGSQNMDWRALNHIHELGVWIADSSVTRFYQDLFELDWNLASGVRNKIRDASLVFRAARRYPGSYKIVQAVGDTVVLQASCSPPAYGLDITHGDLDRIVHQIELARHEIVMQSLSYSPKGRGEFDDEIDIALRRAAARGVKVKMLISDWNQGHPEIDYLKSLACIPGIEARLGTVPEWTGGYIPFARVEHCKYMVVDTLITWIGTANWEPNYFYKTRNVAVTLTNRKLAEQARASFETSWTTVGKPVELSRDYKPKPHGAKTPDGRKPYGN